MMKFFRKALCTLLAIGLMISGSAMAENWYVDVGTDLALRMHALAGEDAYVAMYTDSEEILQQIHDFAQTEISTPETMRMLKLPSGEDTKRLINILAAITDEEMAEMSDAVMEHFTRQVPGVLVSVLNSQIGVSWIATASVLTTSETFIQPEDFAPCVLWMEYPGDYAVAVGFTQTGEDTLTATATITRSGLLDSLTEDMDFVSKLFFNALFQRIEN